MQESESAGKTFEALAASGGDERVNAAVFNPSHIVLHHISTVNIVNIASFSGVYNGNIQAAGSGIMKEANASNPEPAA